MGLRPTWNRYNSATKSNFTAKIYFLKDICTEIVFMKYKGEFQVRTTVNEFFFHTNSSNQRYANYHEIRSHMRSFTIRIYGRRTLFNSLILCWMKSIKLFKVVALMLEIRLFVRALWRFQGGQTKSHTFTVILAVFAPQQRSRWKGLLLPNADTLSDRAIFKWPWKMVSASVRYLFY